MKRLLPVLFPLAVAAQPLVIGAWNIEFLGAPARRSAPSKGVLQDPQDLASYIRQSGSDILSLEEISDDPATEFNPDNTTLAKALALLSAETGQKWKYILFPKKDEGMDQLTGIAWNSAKVSAIDGPYRIPLDDTSPQGFKLWKRWPQAMQFRAGEGQTDFVVIPMHLKANRKDDANDNPPQQRADETRALLRVLAAVRQRFHERDVVLLGDTNCKKASEPALRSVVRGGYRDLNRRDVPTTWEGPAPYDRIFVPAQQKEFRNSREVVHKPAGVSAREFKIRYSDHYLVTTEMEIGPDDD